MTYRRGASALHAAGAAAGCAYCAALAVAALAFEHPLFLAAVLAAVIGAGLAAGVGAELRRAARLAVPLALLIAALNPLISREGLTVLVHGIQLPPFGRLDVTLEALAYGAVLGVRALAVMLCFALYAAAVDPDEVLRLFRRVSLRSALTATLATRLVPVLARDARRLADAQRCRPEGAASRVAVARAVATGALDRAVDVAATLEVRGYGVARRPPRERRARSRHDLALAGAAVALVALTAVALASGAARFAAYPRLAAPGGAAQLALAGALVACALAPFLDRRGIAR